MGRHGDADGEGYTLLERMEQADSLKLVLLQSTLSVAVPLRIEEMKKRPWSFIEERARVCGQVIASEGDNILFRSKKEGKTAEVFNRLAEGIACLAFTPGGVKVFGMHFEARVKRPRPLPGIEDVMRKPKKPRPLE